MKKYLMLASAAIALAAAPAQAQTTNSARDTIGAILGTLFGDRAGSSTSIDAQWAAGQTPLSNQRAQFESRVDEGVRTRSLDQATGTRLKYDYYALVQLETNYGQDGRFTPQERADLSARYNALTQVLNTGGYVGGVNPTTPDVANGRSAFDARVNASVSARRLTRTAGTRLKSEYASLVQVEAGYLRDGVMTDAEQADLDARLDALDARVGDTSYGNNTVVQTPRSRLDAIARAVPYSGLNSAAQAQLLVEQEDLSRLEAAYARLSVTADERAYLESRLVNLETRARIRR
ncbi:MAG: hypothetical protein ABIT16_00855 [Croceibacterium sp.]